MKALLQRVNNAAVEVDGKIIATIGPGLLVYIGVAVDDTPARAEKLAEKVAFLRIFTDSEDKLNLSVKDTGGDILVVPNFTLQADARKGRRPSFIAAGRGDDAEKLHVAFLERLRQLHDSVQTGQFGSHMHVTSSADGPINVIVDI